MTPALDLLVWSLVRTALLLTPLASIAAGSAPQMFDASTVGGPVSNAPAEIYLPAGSGPFPAMVVLHGCDGVGPHYRDWARRLAGWGYVAVLVDSFRPRGVPMVCNHGLLIPPVLQAEDALAAADYLRSRADVRAERIGVIGFSHGGWAVLKAVLTGVVAQAHAKPFIAGVAFYPGCDPPDSPLATDTLILIGDSDDWAPPQRCIRWRDVAQVNGHVLAMRLYPGALHGFDARRPPHVFAGHMVGRDSTAAEDATEMTRRFLADRLMN